MFMAIVLSVVLLIFGVGGLILIHVCLVGRAFRTQYGDGATTILGASFSTGSELTMARRTGMPRGEIDKLPSYDFNGGMLREEVIRSGARSVAVDCAVCLESFRSGEKCRLLPVCSHSFHAKCVDYWLTKMPICPICRTHVAYHWNFGLVSSDEDGVGEEHLESMVADVVDIQGR